MLRSLLGTAWVDIATSVTSESLSLYQRLVNHSSPVYRSAALNIYNTLLSKGTKTPPEKIEIMTVLNVMAFIPTLEQNSRAAGQSRSTEEERFRESLAKLLSSQGVEAVKVYEDVSDCRQPHGQLTANASHTGTDR